MTNDFVLPLVTACASLNLLFSWVSSGHFSGCFLGTCLSRFSKFSQKPSGNLGGNAGKLAPAISRFHIVEQRINNGRGDERQQQRQCLAANDHDGNRPSLFSAAAPAPCQRQHARTT